MTVQSDDGRLSVTPYGAVIIVAAPDLSAQQVFDALLPLLPPPAPTAREVAEAFLDHLASNRMVVQERAIALACRWDEAGRP